jgi:hypothetical protein
MYGVVFLLTEAESLGPRKLISAPEAIEAESVDAAKSEGLQILKELAPYNREGLKPLSIVELSNPMLEEISKCERIFLSNEEEDGDLEFADITETSFWVSQPWWHR